MPDAIERFNPVFDTAARSPADSMPLGNGTLGLNAWIERSADIVFELASAGGSSGSPHRLGRVRVQTLPDAIVGHEGDTKPAIRQTLNLYKGRIEFTLGTGDREASVWLWVDSARNAVHLEAQANYGFHLSATLEGLRDTAPADHSHVPADADGVMIDDGTPRLIRFRRDIPASGEDESSASGSRTVGLAIVGTGAWVRHAADTIGTQKRQRRQAFVIHALDAVTGTTAIWLQAMDRVIADASRTELKDARSDHDRWWRKFWTGAQTNNEIPSESTVLTPDEAIHRFVTACHGNGALPAEASNPTLARVAPR